MRTDGVPAVLRPPVLLYGYAAAAGMTALFLVPRPTIRMRVEGARHLRPGTPYIFCHWHEAIPLFFQANVPRLLPPFRGAPQAWMQHPLWFMKPIHLFLRWIGVRAIVLGSAGHDGRSAADTLVALLKSGHSTVMFPDGPAGPPHVLKKGVLHMAAQSGVPIVPLRLRTSHCLRLPTWDRKIWALPFSTIRLTIGEPLMVDARSPEASAQALVTALG